MSKKILLLLSFFVTIISTDMYSQCENLSIEATDNSCAIPTTTLTAHFLNAEYKMTDEYALNADMPCPPEYAQPIDTGIHVDDGWAPIVFNIGFTFCFYGNMYDQVIISGNGVVSFDLSVVEEYTGSTYPFHAWNIEDGPDLPSPQLQPNAIFGAYTDPDPRNGGTLNFDLVNSDSPGNRIFVIEYKDLPMYSCNDVFFTTRIKLYETSNVIDIEIIEKGPCSWIGGQGIAGIQNKSGTKAVTVPGRTIADGAWSVNGNPDHYQNGVQGDVANQELWRFVPDGDVLNYSFVWQVDYNDGNGYQTIDFPGEPEPPTSFEVNPEEEADYKALLTYARECSYDGNITLEATTIVTPPATVPNVHAPDDKEECETVFGGGTAVFDLESLGALIPTADEILEEFPIADRPNYDITYHETYASASLLSTDAAFDPITTPDLNAYTATDGTIIYIRVEEVGQPACDEYSRSFTLHVLPIDDATFSYIENLSCISNGDLTPDRNDGTFTITAPGVIDANTGVIDVVASGAGDFTITFTTTSGAGTCQDTEEFELTLVTEYDATFDFPNVCLGEEARADNFVAGGEFTVDGGISIDSENGLLDTNTVGTYTVTYTFDLGGACEEKETKTIEVYDLPTAYAPITVMNSCDNGDGTALFNLTMLNNEIIGLQSNMTVTYHVSQTDAESGENPLTATDALVSGNIWARVETQQGCYDIVEVSILIDDCFLVLPEGFSPSSSNPDNQSFDVSSLALRYPNFKLNIYDRYGKLVYEGDATKENWNGKLKNTGNLLPTGTYFYILELNGVQNLVYKAWVYLNE